MLFQKSEWEGKDTQMTLKVACLLVKDRLVLVFHKLDPLEFSPPTISHFYRKNVNKQ